MIQRMIRTKIRMKKIQMKIPKKNQMKIRKKKIQKMRMRVQRRIQS
jgi:hypothetical protein